MELFPEPLTPLRMYTVGPRGSQEEEEEEGGEEEAEEVEDESIQNKRARPTRRDERRPARESSTYCQYFLR